MRLDYCNSVLYGVTNSNMNRLQQVLNAIVCRYRFMDNEFTFQILLLTMHHLAHCIPMGWIYSSYPGSRHNSPQGHSVSLLLGCGTTCHFTHFTYERSLCKQLLETTKKNICLTLDITSHYGLSPRLQFSVSTKDLVCREGQRYLISVFRLD